MPRYDVDLIKSAAEGRWSDIISRLGGVSADILDGNHHPCPKCGGTDRFRALDDFSRSGALLCNQCFASGNGDGLAALQWLTGEDFGKVLDKLAKYIGVKPQKSSKKSDPAAHLEMLRWNRTAAHLWCKEKPPVTVAALERLGAQYAKYRKHYTVIAIPVWGAQLDNDPPAGWIIYRSDGGKLPRYKKKGQEPDWVKVKLTEGSQQGIVTCLEDWKKIGGDEGPHTWWKLEGSTDLLAAMSQDWPEGHAFFTTANGATEKPLEWVMEGLRDCRVHVCHDADQPGQQGATWVEQAGDRRRAGWAPSLAKLCSEVRNVCLPFPVEQNHGPDIRDFFNGGGRVSTLLERAGKAEVWEREAAKEENYVEYDIANARHLAELNVAKYEGDHKRTLRYWRGEWYRFKGTRYEKIDSKHLEVRVRGFIEDYFEECWKAGTDERTTVRDVTRQIVGNTIAAMERKCFLSPSIELDTWVNDAYSNECVAFQNKILNLRKLFDGCEDSQEYLLPHSPDWFSMTCLPYDCDLRKNCPAWLSFLQQVLEDPESIEALQRWFGYLLLPDTSLQKMMFIIGPTRSGKGTMMKVMINLFGRETVASPTLNGLISDFALHSMYGKSIAIIPDARLSRKADREAVTEKLLSLVANDPQDIRRMYLNTLSGVEMNLRFTLFSNKLPELDDSTAAMAGRGIYLLMPNSFYGREDTHLSEKLLAELPGILNWAIVGRHKLQQHGRIEQPEASRHLVRQMRMQMAPVSQFFSECTRSHSKASGVLSSDVFERWHEWASDNGFVTKQRMTVTEFERRAIDANPGLRIERVKLGTAVDRKFIGLELLSDD